ncbi:unnamed protein product [Pseudo-nitzschia multistriata]|uniref:Uncharacterized protein n=1 Tax=Pseudo-nitzschia multistriata TaxID=183589 RepID=A0A448ZD56_9STRA|nr:unnamed protein product [Pseudo-nitzschia multistriata]
MNDELGGTSTTRVPAWKLRQQQRQSRPPVSSLHTRADDELGGGGRSYASRRRANDELGGGGRSFDSPLSSSSNNDELGGARSARVPAWKLREQMKRGNNHFKTDLDDANTVSTSSTTGSNLSVSSPTHNASHNAPHNASHHPFRTTRQRPVSRVPGAPDPGLPPAFRAAFRKQQERKKTSDSFLNLSSVHSRTTACSNTNYTAESNGSLGSLGSSSDDDSFDGEDSFASLDSDADEDDEAYRESRNQLARLEIEKQQQSKDAKRVGPSRFKKKPMGVHGTPLGFIAE